MKEFLQCYKQQEQNMEEFLQCYKQQEKNSEKLLKSIQEILKLQQEAPQLNLRREIPSCPKLSIRSQGASGERKNTALQSSDRPV